jgi:pilus assembly protein Flp/PilA
MNLVRWSRLVKDTRGAGMVEYIILVGVIAILAMGAFKTFGSTVQSKIKGQNGTVDSTVDTTTTT